MPKLKKLPNTKKQKKYLGPYTVSRLTESHAFIPNPKPGVRKENKIPIDIVRPYYERDAGLERCTQRKRKLESVVDSHQSKKLLFVSIIKNFEITVSRLICFNSFSFVVSTTQYFRIFNVYNSITTE